MDNRGPLSDVRVVELAAWVAGPAASGIMADWGADVIKIEPTGGDPQRSLFGSIGGDGAIPVPPFELDNRGKRSVVLDLRAAEGLARSNELIAGADVFVTNMRPSALERLGLDHESVCAANPSLIYGAVTGYGLDGPDRDRAGYDTGAYWARSGLAHTTVPKGEPPTGLRSGSGDHQTAMTLVAGVTAKLYERASTGRGGLVSTSLLRTGMYSLGWDMGIQLRFGRRESTRPRERSSAPLINSYRAGDDRFFWLICLEADRHWPKVLEAIERPELADDERFHTAASRYRNSADLIAELDAEFVKRPMAEWGPRFDELDVWWSPVNTIAEVIEDPQAQPGFVDMVPDEGEDPFRAVATPVDFGGYTPAIGPVPRLGEHTEAVLRELAGGSG
ncbi:MAG: CoA transferase [Acidimicrobiia bacterium]|nr:CoA transferase [Acidimicrobiia bacterium]